MLKLLQAVLYLSDVKEGTTVAGVPAKEVVTKSSKKSPADEVDHNIYRN